MEGSFWWGYLHFPMKLSKLLLIGAVILGLYEVYRLKAAGSLVFFPGSVSDIGFEGVSPVITFTLLAQNTSSVPVMVDSLAGNMFANGTLIGNMSSFTPTTVPGNGQAYIPVKASLMVIGIVNDIVKAFTSKNTTQIIDVEGNVNVQGAQIPLSIPLSIGA